MPRGFYGREAELAALGSMFTEASSGRAGLGLVVGDAGIGKSRLASEFADAVGSEALVAWGRCETVETAPYWPWTQSLRACARACNTSDLRDELGTRASDLAMLVPELRTVLPGLPAATFVAQEASRLRLFDDLTIFLDIASRARPIVIVLEDLHWADEPSLVLLEFLASTLRSQHVLVLGTLRPPQPQGRLASTLVELLRTRATRFELTGLARADAGTFLDEMAGEPVSTAVADVVYEKTAGNPFHLGEVIRLLAAQSKLSNAALVGELALPPTVIETVRRRLEGLAPDTIAVLESAALVGETFGLDLLGALSAVANTGVLRALDDARGLALVTATAPGRYQFTHSLIRDALYQALPTERRIALHQTAAQELERRNVDDLEPVVPQLAHHWLQVAPAASAEPAVRYCAWAGELAAERLAFEEAAAQFQRALAAHDLLDHADPVRRVELLLALGEAQDRAGRAQEARDTYEDAAGRARRIGAAELLGRAGLGAGGRFIWASRWDDSLARILQAALDLLPPEDSSLRCQLLARLSTELIANDAPARDRLSAEAIAMARRLGRPDDLAFALDARFMAIWRPGTLDERRALAEELVVAADAARDLERQHQAHHWRMVCLLESGDFASVEREEAVQFRVADRLQQPVQRWYTLSSRALRVIFRGDLEEGERLASEAFALGAGSAPVAFEAFGMQIAIIRREQGRIAEMIPMLDAAAGQLPLPGLASFSAWLRLEAGDREAAEAIYAPLAAKGFADIVDNLMFITLTCLCADLASAFDDDAAAARLERMLLPWGDRCAVQPPGVCLGSVAHWLGTLAATQARLDDAEAWLRRAVDENRRMGGRIATVRSECALARVLLRRDRSEDRSEARAIIAAAGAEADRLGLVTLRAELDALQSTATADSRVGHDAPGGMLTSRELDVLRCLARGLSNKQIAAELFIAEKTVRNAVSNVFAKLHVTSRTQAAVYASDHGLA